MSSKTIKGFTFIYLSILILHIVLDTMGSFWHYLTKPALVLSLLMFFLKQSTHLDKRTRNVLVLALLFSLMGDSLLMFVSKSMHFFTGGLFAFLLAHIFFIILFYRKKSKKPLGFGLSLGTILYMLLILNFISSNLGTMRYPVILYMVIIMLMFLAATHRQKEVGKLSYNLILIGAILFVVSDSILALNKFYKPILYPQISIMLTYGLAQLLITLGILKQDN